MPREPKLILAELAPPPRLAADTFPVFRQPLTVTIDLDRPDGHFYLSRSNIEPGQTLVLRGRVKRLKLYTQPGMTVDATGLAVEEISVSGVVTGSVLKLSAPKGEVQFHGELTGRSKVEVHAPGGTVRFIYSGANVSGGTRLTIAAARLMCKGEITGDGTHVHVTLDNGGLIAARGLRGKSVLEYRKSNPADIAPALEIGARDPEAVTRRLD